MKLFRSVILRTTISISITVLFIVLIALRVNWFEIKNSFGKFNAMLIIPSIILYLSSFIFRALRWQIFFKGIKRISFALNFEVIMIGMAANNLLPARMGEVVRAYVMGKRARISRSASLATILVERIFDGLTLILLLFVVLQFFHFPDWVQNVGIIGIMVFGGTFLFFFLLNKKSQSLHSALTHCTGRFSSRIQDFITEFYEKFSTGLQILSNPLNQLIVFSYTVIIWCIEAITYFLILKGFQIAIPFAGALFTLILVNIGILIPSSPGYIGTFQFFAILALSLFGVPEAEALSFAIVIHAIQYISVTLPGGIFMSRMGLRWSEVKTVQ